MDWKNEPDEVFWVDADTGLSCRIIRHSTIGHLCGYVGVPQGHPWHGMEYDSLDAEVHGGLTYSGPRVAYEDEDGHWWVGFDCAHSGDHCPYMQTSPRHGEVYRNMAYVRREVKSLAAQIKAA